MSAPLTFEAVESGFSTATLIPAPSGAGDLSIGAHDEGGGRVFALVMGNVDEGHEWSAAEVRHLASTFERVADAMELRSA